MRAGIDRKTSRKGRKGQPNGKQTNHNGVRFFFFVCPPPLSGTKRGPLVGFGRASGFHNNASLKGRQTSKSAGGENREIKPFPIEHRMRYRLINSRNRPEEWTTRNGKHRTRRTGRKLLCFSGCVWGVGARMRMPGIRNGKATKKQEAVFCGTIAPTIASWERS